MLKLAGKPLSRAVDDFIMHIEQRQNQALDPSKKSKKQKDSNALKNKVLRETRCIPKMIFDTEQLAKSVIQLSNKTKCDLTRYIGLGITRDFRIKDLKTVMEKVVNESSVNDVTDMDVDESEISEEENASSAMPPPKKTKK